MNKSVTVLLSSLLLAAGWAHSQSSQSPTSPQGEVRESTDPSRAAEVEQRAKEISSGQSGVKSGASSSEQDMQRGKTQSKSGDQEKSESSSGGSDTSPDASGTSGTGTSAPTPYEAGPGSSSSVAAQQKMNMVPVPSQEAAPLRAVKSLDRAA